MRDAARSLADERFTERCRGETIFGFDAGAAALHLARRGRVERDEKVVQSSGTRQARVQGGVEHALVVAQKRFYVFQRKTLQEILRRHAGPGRKEPMKMEGNEPALRASSVRSGYSV